MKKGVNFVWSCSLEAMKEIQMLLEKKAFEVEAEEQLLYAYDSSMVDEDGNYPAVYIGAHQIDDQLSYTIGVGDENTTFDNSDSGNIYIGHDDTEEDVENMLAEKLEESKADFKQKN